MMIKVFSHCTRDIKASRS